MADLTFNGSLRPAQQAVAEIASAQLSAGEHRLHIVAPPGSGKTVLGLYLWSALVKKPAVVLSPNSAIQSQWAMRAIQFCGIPGEHVSQDPRSPALFTSLTYQSVTLPSRGDEAIETRAIECWKQRLVADGDADDEGEARIWLEDLQTRNRDYFDSRLAAYVKQLRDELGRESGGALATLHASAQATLAQLKEAGVGLVILDECHHLMGHWGRVLRDAHEFLEFPVVVGLTATPPDRVGKDARDIDRYDKFFGPVDFEIPVPALVRDGYLSPYQDLVYFVRPTTDELAFIANTDNQLTRIIDQLCAPSSSADGARIPLPQWVSETLAARSIGPIVAQSWGQFERRDPAFASTGLLFLRQRGLAMPRGVPPPDPRPQLSPLDLMAPLLDRYIRHHLRRSEDPTIRECADEAIRSLRTLGIQITETGMQPCASPVSRVMAYSTAKVQALHAILTTEMAALGDTIRAAVIADYEKTSAIESDIQHLLDDEAGGAIAAFRMLLADEKTDAIDPVLVTGSSVLVDNDLKERFNHAAEEWLSQHNHDVALEWSDCGALFALQGGGSDWCPRVYVALVTELFQNGVTRCLVGTRGLLGEGWDASKINVLLDLTTVTTSMSVNQLRGRSIRLDTDNPEKVANNWDVVCLAPEFRKGLDDYARFRRKHHVLYGVTDDSAIEKGVGHVHPAFTEMKPEGVEGSVSWINSEMLARARRRAESREQWRIGTPYNPKPIRATELQLGTGGGGFPPFSGSQEPWSDASLTAAVSSAVFAALAELSMLEGGQPHVGTRQDGYVRVFLSDANNADMLLFTESLGEALGAFDKVRYIIPREVTEFEQTWLSRILPAIVSRYFRRKQRRLAMWHAVPSALAVKKELVAVYQKHWNEHVSPGAAVYVHRGEGTGILDQARAAALTPQAIAHDKEIFL